MFRRRRFCLAAEEAARVVGRLAEGGAADLTVGVLVADRSEADLRVAATLVLLGISVRLCHRRRISRWIRRCR